MDVLEKLLLDLHSTAVADGLEASDPNTLIGNIEACFKEYDMDEIESAISLLLTSQVPQNIFYYFNTTIRSKDRVVIKSKIAAFKLLSSLVKQAIGVNAQMHVSLILDSCLNIFRRETSNEVKSSCLGPIKNIFRNSQQYPEVFSDNTPPAKIFYDAFTEELQTNKQAKGLRAELLTTLGLLLRRVRCEGSSGAESVMSWSGEVTERAWSMLTSNILGSKEPDLPQLSGALSALDRCLSIQTHTCVVVTDLWKMILKIVSSLANPAVSRYAHIRKALRLVCSHGVLFEDVIGLNAQQGYNVFLSCSKAGKDTLKKYADDAVLVVLQQMAQYAAGAAEANFATRSDISMKTVVQLSSQFIRSMHISANNSADRDINIAVKGLAALAPAYPYFEATASTTPDGVDGMVAEIIQASNHYVRSQREDSSDERTSGILQYSNKLLERKADFLLAVASMILSPKVLISSEILLFLSEYGVDIIVGYSRLWFRVRKIVHQAVGCLLIGLIRRRGGSTGSGCDLKCNEVINTLLSTILARTVSRLVPGEQPEMSPFDPVTGELDDRLYSVYFPLWEAIYDVLETHSRGNTEAVSMQCSGREPTSVATVFYDAMMGGILRYFREGDFSYTSNEISVGKSDDNVGEDNSLEVVIDPFTPHNAADQELLLNLVSFLEIFLARRILEWRLKKEWLPVFVKVVSQLSLQFPAVSALYRTLRAILCHCGISVDEPQRDISSFSDSTHDVLLAYCKNLINQVGGFQQELLHSALSLLLVPVLINLVGFSGISSAIVVALDADMLIESSVGAMEMFIGHADLIDALPTILPMLDKQLVGVVSDIQRGGLPRRDVNIPVGPESNDAMEKQRCILRFLGRLGGYNKLILGNQSTSSVDSESLSLDGHNVPYQLPVLTAGSPLCIYFDRLIPRITELCAQVTDRTTRTAAAELLHTVIILMLGSSASDPSYRSTYATADKTSLSPLYERVLPVALSLAVSSDLVCRALFEKLMLQTTHWFSGLSQVPKADTTSLIDCLIQALSCTNETELREFSARLLSEYFHWSIKQTSGSEIKKGGTDLPCDVLLERLLGLAVHPLPGHRRGVISVLNKIYKYFREEKPLVERFLLRVIYALMLCMRIEPLSIIEQVLHRYIHMIVTFVKRENGDSGIMLGKCVEVKQDTDDKESVESTPGFPGSLQELLHWAFGHVLHDRLPFRRSCMMLLTSLCPLLSYDYKFRELYHGEDRSAGKRSSTHQAIPDDKFTAFVITHLNTTESRMTPGSILSDEIGDIASSKSALKRLSSAADVFTWLISSNFVPLDDVFSNSTVASMSLIEAWKTVAQYFETCGRVVFVEADDHIASGDLLELRAEALRRALHLMVCVLDKAKIVSTPSRCVQGEILRELDSLMLLSEVNIEFMLRLLFDTSNGKGYPQLPLLSDSLSMGKHIPVLISRLLQHINSEAEDTKVFEIVRTVSGKILEEYLSVPYILNCPEESLPYVSKSISLLLRVSGSTSGNSAHLMSHGVMEELLKLFEPLSSAVRCTTKAKALVQCVVDIGELPIAVELKNARADVGNRESIMDYLFSAGSSGLECFDMCYGILVAALLRQPSRLRSVCAALLDVLTSGRSTEEKAISTKMLLHVLEQLCGDPSIVPGGDLLLVLDMCVRRISAAAWPVTLLEMVCRFELVVRVTVFNESSEASGDESSRIELRRALVDILAAKLKDNSDGSSTELLKYIILVKYVVVGTAQETPITIRNVSSNDHASRTFVEALEELVANKFPMNTESIDPNSASGLYSFVCAFHVLWNTSDLHTLTLRSGIEYSTLFSTLLRLLVDTGSIDILNPLLSSLRAGTKHRYYRWIVKAFRKLVANINMSTEEDALANTLVILNYCYALLTDKYESVKVKLTLKEHLWVPLLNRIPMMVLSKLTTLCISSDGIIYGVCSRADTTSGDSSVISSFLSIVQKSSPSSSMTGDSELQSFYVTLQCAYLFVEVVYSRCSLAHIKGIITQSFAGPSASGKELTSAICRAAHKQVRVNISSDSLINVKQGVSSAAFNCLLTVVAKTQSEEKNYDNFLFTEKPTEAYWNNVVDCTVEYIFGAECAVFPSLVVGSTDDDSGDLAAVKNSILQQRSVNKFGIGSLSQDYFGSSLQVLSGRISTSASDNTVSRVEATTSSSIRDDDAFYSSQCIVQDGPKGGTGGNNESKQVIPVNVEAVEEAVIGFDDYAISIEMNDVNTQPCMAPLVRVILRMAVLFSERWSQTPDTMPRWLREVVVRIDNKGLSRNVRLFFLRLLFNQPVTAIIADWASQLLPVILEASLSLTASFQGGSLDEYNYFLRDVVFTVVDTWADVVLNIDAIPVCSQFLETIISVCYNSKTGIFGENVKSVCSLISLWVSKSQVTMASLGNTLGLSLSHFFASAVLPTGGAHASSTSRGSQAVQQRLAGLRIIRCFLDSGFDFLQQESCNTVGGIVLEHVVDALKYPRKEVLELASAISGRLLLMIDTAKYNLVSACSGYESAIERMLFVKLNLKGGLDDVSTALVAISEKYAKFGSRELVLKLLSSFSKFSSRSKSYFLLYLVRSTVEYDPPLSIIEYLSPYILSLLSDQYSIAEGRGVRMRYIKTIRLFTIRLLYRHIRDIKLAWYSSLLGNSNVEGLSLVVSSGMEEEGGVLIRKEAYALLMRIYDTFSEALECSAGDNMVNFSVYENRESLLRLRQRVLILLMRGLTDWDDTGMNQTQVLDKSTQSTSALLGESNIRTSSDIGIRKMVYNFLKEKVSSLRSEEQQHIGESKKKRKHDSVSGEATVRARIIALMTQYYDPLCSDQWLNYSSYLLLESCTSGESTNIAEKFIFNKGLGDEDDFHELQISPETQSQTGQAIKDPRRPMFSLERTSQSVLSQSQTSGNNQDIILSQFGATSQYYQPRKGGYLRSTQQFDWSQTQSASQNVNDSENADGAHRSGRPVSSRNSRSIFAPTQMIDSGFPTFLRSSSIVSSLAHGSSQYSQASMATNSAETAAVTQSMGPPLGVPSRFVPKALISQRLPHRFQNISRNTTDSESGTDTGELKGTARKIYSSKLRTTQQKRQRQSAHKNRVNVYRKYRDGELPDILISHFDVIQPLQALCLKDNTLSGIVFASLFEVLYGKTDNEYSDPESLEHATRDMRRCVFHILGSDMTRATEVNEAKTSVLIPVMDHKLISCMLSCSIYCLREEYTFLSKAIAAAKTNNVKALYFDPDSSHRNKRRALASAESTEGALADYSTGDGFFVSDLDARLISSLSMQSMNYHTGILLLEEQLLVRNLRTSAQKESPQLYHDGSLRQLCNLYEALGDKDTLVGVYTKLISIEETKRALDAEIAGNYPEAIDYYNDLIMKYRLSSSILSREMSGGKNEAAFERNSVLKPSEEEAELWDDRSLQCLQQLMDWGQLDEKLNIVAEAQLSEASVPMLTSAYEPSHWEIFLLNPSTSLAEKKKKFLPLKLNCLINIDRNEDDLKHFLETLLTSPRDSPQEHLRKYIEVVHPAELTTAFGVIGDWTKVKTSVLSCYDQFLNTWSVLHKCAAEARTALLSQLQVVTELEDSAYFKLKRMSTRGADAHSRGFDKQLVKSKLLDRWEKSIPFVGDSVMVWSNVIKGRHLLLDSEGGSEAALHLSKMHIKFARAAVHQGSLRVVKGQIAIGGKYRRAAQTESGNSGGKDLVTLDEVLAVYAYNRLTIDTITKSNNYQSELVKILAIFDKTTGLLDKKLSQIIEESTVACTNRDYVKLCLLKANWICGKWGVLQKPVSGDGFNSAVEAYNVFSELATGLKGVQNDSLFTSDSNSTLLSAQDIKILGTSYALLARHCDDMRGHGVTYLPGVSSNVTSVCIDSYLKGLRLCNLSCRDRVVPIIQLIASVHPRASIPEDVALQLRNVPAWLFLRHAAQLVGYFDRPEGFISTMVLERVAERYPSAMYYHFKIASEGLGSQGKSLVGRLAQLLQNPSIDCFVEALDGLTHPDLRVIDMLKEAMLYHRTVVGPITDTMVNEALKYVNCKKNDKELPFVTLCNMLSKCKSDATALSWTHVDTRIGSYNRAVTREFKKLFDSNLPSISNCSTLYKLSDSTLPALFSKVKDTVSRRFVQGKVPLSEFSEWLTGFDFELHKIEIPGQYISADYACEPDVSRHALIMGFDPRLLVMSSIRRPKRITMYSADGAESQFLVKGGEDLRNDDRIEQLFSLMNSILSSASGAANSSGCIDVADDMASGTTFGNTSGGRQPLAARTFAVIPMTSKLGILEWCQGTVPFKSVLTTELSKDEAFLASNPSAVVRVSQASSRGSRGSVPSSARGGVQLEGSEASHMRQKWLTDEGGYVGTIHKLCRSVKSGSTADNGLEETSATKMWDTMLETIPNDLIRRYLLSKAKSPEFFYAFRAEFAKTIAVASIYGYILGIGDRHLDNLLIDERTGSVVMIDFGICFGMGASCLPVPELIPFRLTSQVTNVLRPLHGVYQLRHYMLKTLTALREKEGVDRLRNDLEVYINDPLVDWMKGSGVQKDEIESLREVATWEPRRRVNAVLNKLNGASPVTTLLGDLDANPSVKKNKIIEGYCNLLSGVDSVAVDNFLSSRKDCTIVGNCEKLSRSRNKKRKQDSIDEEASSSLNADQGLSLGGAIDSAASQGSSCLKTPAEQIDILIELGTSPEILCRQYEGLVTWM